VYKLAINTRLNRSVYPNDIPPYAIFFYFIRLQFGIVARIFQVKAVKRFVTDK